MSNLDYEEMSTYQLSDMAFRFKVDLKAGKDVKQTSHQ